jgi:tRNA threonylcarbamoyladenosine biosynthesis protein TsaE
MFVLTLHSSSARETRVWGRRLASLLSGGELLGFSGELGAGKTCFIKGLARGLNLQEERIPTLRIMVKVVLEPASCGRAIWIDQPNAPRYQLVTQCEDTVRHPM